MVGGVSPNVRSFALHLFYGCHPSNGHGLLETTQQFTLFRGFFRDFVSFRAKNVRDESRGCLPGLWRLDSGAFAQSADAAEESRDVFCYWSEAASRG